MTAPLPLAIHPWPPSDAHLATLRAAKASLNSPLKIIPAEAAYGSPGRVLCFGEMPDFLCRTAPIRPENTSNAASVAEALKLCLGEMEGWAPDARFDETWLLSQWMGAEVTPIGEERYDEDSMRWEAVHVD